MSVSDCVVLCCTWLQLSLDSDESPLQRQRPDVRVTNRCSGDIVCDDNDDDDDFVGMYIGGT